MTDYILFFFYLILFCYLITKIRFSSGSELSHVQLVSLFLIKIAVGILYGWLALNENNKALGFDTWTYHSLSLKETQLLFNDPSSYFTNIFPKVKLDSFQAFFSSTNSYWNNLKLKAIVKLLSIFNCFSSGNYYVNIIFYSFITFFGSVAIFKVMKDHLKANNLILIISCFLIPSFLYWCSGVHKDGLTFLAIAVIMHQFYFYFLKGTTRVKNFLLILCGLVTLFILKNHILMVLLPALFAWCASAKWPHARFKIFGLVYIAATIFFFGASYISPDLNFPQIVAEKQKAFNDLSGGNTSLKTKPIDASLSGFIHALPQSISLAAFRPYPSDIYKPIILPAFIELIAIWLLFALSFLNFRNMKFSPFTLFIIFFVISTLLMIGYTVNNLGATARYRAFLFPLFTPFILSNIAKLVRKNR